MKKNLNYSINVQQLILNLQKHSKFNFIYFYKTSFFFLRPLWIDSLYGSNNSNLPSIYDDTYSRTRRSNATTTNDYHPSTLGVSTQKSTDQINEITKYSLTDVILQESNVLDSKICEKSEEKQIIKSSIRRIQSDYDLIQLFSINENHLIKKSKSMIDIQLNLNQETPITLEQNESVC